MKYPTTPFGARLSLLPILLAPIVLGACSTRMAIVNHWVHSHEEDSASSRVYRPRTFDFPISRGREEWDLHANGSVIHHEISPADGIDRHAGTWALSKDGQLSISLPDGNLYFQVEHVDTTRLVMRALPNAPKQ